MGKGENIQSRGELVHFQLSRVALGDTHGSRDTRSFRLLRGPSETRSRHRFPHVAILAFKSSDLFVVYLSIYPIYDTCVRRPTSRRRWRFAQLNTIRSVLCFSFLPPPPQPPLIFLRSPTRVRSINVYDAARSPSLFYAFRVIS